MEGTSLRHVMVWHISNVLHKKLPCLAPFCPPSVKINLPAIRAPEACKNVQQRGFSAAICPVNADALSRTGCYIHTRKHFFASIGTHNIYCQQPFHIITLFHTSV